MGKEKQGTATVGFKSLTVRILDGGTPTEGTNVFTIQGKKEKALHKPLKSLVSQMTLPRHLVVTSLTT